jgi:proteasome lid subunit RPN8/RPN11
MDSKRAHPNPLVLFQNTRCQAIESGEELLGALANDLKCGDSSRLEYYWQRFPFLCNAVEMANEASRLYREDKPQASQEVEPTTQTFLISSLFLYDCQAYLTSNPKGHERLHLVTGIKLSPKRRTLDNMVKVALTSESAVSALADQHALQKTLIEMDEWGHHLYGLFHSHPGKGAQATNPSDTDLKTHERHEQGGYPLVSAIFVKDGFVRFFGHHPFTITIYGKGLEKIDEDQHVYKINNLPSNLPH